MQQENAILFSAVGGNIYVADSAKGFSLKDTLFETSIFSIRRSMTLCTTYLDDT
jgi:hypothetical protein